MTRWKKIQKKKKEYKQVRGLLMRLVGMGLIERELSMEKGVGYKAPKSLPLPESHFILDLYYDKQPRSEALVEKMALAEGFSEKSVKKIIETLDKAGLLEKG